MLNNISNKNINKNINKKAYSLVEMLVTMAIFSIIITMLLQSLFLNIKLTNQINFRSKFNTDLDQMVSLIERDIRNADYYYSDDSGVFIKGCKENISYPVRNTDCTLSSNDKDIKWYLVDTVSNTIPIIYPDGTINRSVKRAKQSGTAEPIIDYNSTNLLNVVELEFFIDSTENSLLGEAKYANILVTIKVKPAIESWTSKYGINEQVRQFSVSTRNYEVKF
jgi:prepilin-type N-terminal cleavage/methylation domain-containing protein